MGYGSLQLDTKALEFNVESGSFFEDGIIQMSLSKSILAA